MKVISSCFEKIVWLLLLLLDDNLTSAFTTSTTTTSTSAPVATFGRRSTTTQLDAFFRKTKTLEKLEKKEIPDKEIEELLESYSERARLYRRDVFTAADWINSRRDDRFVDNFKSIFDSGLIRQVAKELSVLALFSTFIVFYNDLFVEGFVDFHDIKHDPLVHLPALQLPMTPFTVSTSALGLLLAFRTNVSYARWNEARTAWGKVINDSRSIVRMGCIWARSYNNIDDHSLQRLGEAVCSFSRSLMNRTLPSQEDGEKFRRYTIQQLSDQNYAEVLRDAKHRPTAALAEITQIMVDYKLNPIHQVEVERVITGLCDALGASERIFTSPVPRFYTRFTARFLAVYLFFLPLGLYEPFGSTWNHLAMIPSAMVIGLFLLGIEELATELEEPFSILPMEKMCEGSIRTPVMEQVERSKIGLYQPENIIPAGVVPPESIYAAPVKVKSNDGSPPRDVAPDPVPPFPVSVPVASSAEIFSSGDISDADRARLSMYLDPPQPWQQQEQQSKFYLDPQPLQQEQQQSESANNQGDLSIEEMNRLWATRSGSLEP